MKMKIPPVVNENIKKLQESLMQKEQERLTNASITSEILADVNVATTDLPQRSQQLLYQASTAQASSELEQLNPVTISVYKSRQIDEELDDEYEILKIRQKNEQLQVKIDRNNRTIDHLKKDLAESRETLAKQSPNPENIQEYCWQIKKKIALYEASYEKAKKKFSSLSVPEHAMPTSMARLATSLAELCEQADSLRRSAEDIEMAREARVTLRSLMRR